MPNLLNSIYWQKITTFSQVLIVCMTFRFTSVIFQLDTFIFTQIQLLGSFKTLLTAQYQSVRSANHLALPSHWSGFNTSNSECQTLYTHHSAQQGLKKGAKYIFLIERGLWKTCAQERNHMRGILIEVEYCSRLKSTLSMRKNMFAWRNRHRQESERVFNI